MQKRFITTMSLLILANLIIILSFDIYLVKLKDNLQSKCFITWWPKSWFWLTFLKRNSSNKEVWSLVFQYE